MGAGIHLLVGSALAAKEGEEEIHRQEEGEEEEVHRQQIVTTLYVLRFYERKQIEPTAVRLGNRDPRIFLLNFWVL